MKRSVKLDDWLSQVRGSSLPLFVAFARSVERDKAAIIAGLMLPYSTGPVEGHIHRLKLIKRQAYGRASLAYLQQRFLADASVACGRVSEKGKHLWSL